jgi:hypothetical protein
MSSPQPPAPSPLPLCRWCGEPVESRLHGMGMHPECMFRACAGSVAHIEGRCSCFVPGSTAGDDPRLTKRQQAEASVACWRRLKVERALAIARGRRN